VVIPAAEAGLQRGTLLMQPADRQITKAFRFPKEVYPSWSPWRPWRTSVTAAARRMIFLSRSFTAGITKAFRLSEIRNHTSDILFKNKADQFRTGAVDRPNGEEHKFESR